MREDEEFGHLVPVLRRIIILVAVITAIPVVLWTITAFVRTYVSPPKIPTFHQLAATASINAPSNANANDGAGGPPQGAAEQAKNSAAVEARAKPTDTRDANAAPKGPFLGDRLPESTGPATASLPPATATASLPAASMTASPASTASAAASPPIANGTAIPPTASAAPASIPAANASKMPDTLPAAAPATKPADMATPAVTAAADSAPTGMVVAEQPPPATTEPPADTTSVVSAAEPLAGPIPLPRHRPRIAESRFGETTRMASAGPIPMPRPRPEAAGPGASADDSGGPLGFLQSLFGGK